jgi:hypothetical protein
MPTPPLTREEWIAQQHPAFAPAAKFQRPPSESLPRPDMARRVSEIASPAIMEAQRLGDADVPTPPVAAPADSRLRVTPRAPVAPPRTFTEDEVFADPYGGVPAPPSAAPQEPRAKFAAPRPTVIARNPATENFAAARTAPLDSARRGAIQPTRTYPKQEAEEAALRSEMEAGPNPVGAVLDVLGGGLRAFAGDRNVKFQDWRGNRRQARSELEAAMQRNKAARMSDPASPESRRMQDIWLARGMADQMGMNESDVRKMVAEDFKGIDDPRSAFMNYQMRLKGMELRERDIAGKEQGRKQQQAQFETREPRMRAQYNLGVTKETLKGNKELRAAVTAYGQMREKSGVDRHQFWTDEINDGLGKLGQTYGGGKAFTGNAQQLAFLKALNGSTPANLASWLDSKTGGNAKIGLDPEQMRLLRNVATLQNTLIYDASGKAINEKEFERLQTASGTVWAGSIDGIKEHIDALGRLRAEAIELQRKSFGAATVDSYESAADDYKIAPRTDRDAFRREFPDLVLPPMPESGNAEDELDKAIEESPATHPDPAVEDALKRLGV